MLRRGVREGMRMRRYYPIVKGMEKPIEEDDEDVFKKHEFEYKEDEPPFEDLDLKQFLSPNKPLS